MNKQSGSIITYNNGKPVTIVRLIMAFTLLVTYTSCSFVQEKNEIIQTYNKKDTLQIKGFSGSKFHISSSDADRIEIRLANYNNPEFRYSIEEVNQSLIISEDIINYNGQKPTPKSGYRWSLILPKGLYVKTQGATCDLQLINFSGTFICQCAKCNALIEEAKGHIQINTAKFDIKISDSEGDFDFSAADGDIEADAISLTGPSTFTTGHGDIELSLSGTIKHDLIVGSSFGRAILNYQDNPVEGSFEFIARADKGKIVCPFNFDLEEIFRDEKKHYKNESDFGVLVDYNRKSFIRGNQNPRITLKTVTGTVKLLIK